MNDAELPVQVPLVTEAWGIWQSFQAARRNLLELIPEIATRQPIVSGRTGKRWHMVMDPAANRHILRDALADYPKSDVTKLILRPGIGESLFVAEGAHWHWQRRAAAPAFSPRNVQALAPVMTAAAQRAAERVGTQAGRAVNLFDEMVATTFEVISDVTFTGGERFDRDAVHRAINAYIDQTARVSLLDIIGAPGWVPRLARMRAAPAIAAPWTMEMPIPPEPMIRTWSPGCTPAVLIAAPTPVCTAQPITQATSSGTSTGMATAPEAATMTSSAQAPRPRPRYTTSDPPPAPEPTGRERWVVPSGNIGMAMEIDPVHTDGSPRRQYSHRPHAGFGLSTT